MRHRRDTGSDFRLEAPYTKMAENVQGSGFRWPTLHGKRLAKSLAMIVLGGPIAARGFMSGSFDGEAGEGG